MALWSRLFSGVFGVGVGIAAADAVQPVVEVARQDAWKANANRVLTPDQLAALLAQGLISAGTAVDHASRNGYSSDKLDALAQLAMHAPGIPEALNLWRRGEIDEAQFRHALRKANLEPQYDAALELLKDDRLSPEVVALAIVRGLIADPGILPVAPPTGTGTVPAFPVFPIPAVKESEAGGFDLARLSVLTGIAGRPMSPEAAASAFFRSIIDRVDYDRAVSESDVRNEWRDAILEQQRAIVHPAEAAGLRLKGWVTQAEAEALGAKWGASPETMQQLFLERGRPATVKETFRAYARGAELAGFAGDPVGAERRAVEESDIRPEWADILIADAPNYPSLFQLNRLVASAAITAAQAADWARKSGYAAEVVTALEAYWSKPSAAGTGSWTKRAQTQLWSSTHRGFMKGDVDEAAATGALDVLGLTAAEVTTVLDLWTVERAQTRRDLTQAQVLKLFRKAIWTRVQAEDWLIAEGMATTDANALLDSV